MKITNLKINDLITPDKKLTFLAGAGCSIDPPSCLPAGRAMMDALIDYTCAESEIEKIKSLNELRFEQLIEIIRDRLDPELKVIDYYGQCDKPNLQHFFLAEMIENGHFVMTTNFDFLIEYALQARVPKEEIIVVITKEDFEKFSNPQELYSNGLKAIYKIHGSTTNVLKPEGQRDTKDSLIATIQAFGANKEGENVFQLEYFKKPLFENITKGRSLVVMGYSGSDDFDIVPTLKVLELIQDIIWINHSEDITIGEEQIHKIDANTRQTLDKLDKVLRKVTQILLEMWQMNNVKHVYRVDVNTTDMTKKLLKSKPKLSYNDFSINSRNWVESNLDLPSMFIKYYISYKIYFDFDLYDDALRCSEKILQLSKNSKDKFWEVAALNNIGAIYKAKGNYPEALKLNKKALKICEQLGDLSVKATLLNNIAVIHDEQGKSREVLERYEEALKIYEQLGDLRGKANCLINISRHFGKKSKGILIESLLNALKRQEEALRLCEQLGDLSGKASLLKDIAKSYYRQKKYPKALKRYNEALQIAEQIGNLSGKANCLNEIGSFHLDQGDYPTALKQYEEALEIFIRIGLRDSPDAIISKGKIKDIKSKIIELKQRIEDMELQEKEIPVSFTTQEEIIIKKVLVFIIYATKDAKLFKIKEVIKSLKSFEDVEVDYYRKQNTKDYIIKNMNDNLGKCDVVLLFCSPNELISKSVEWEWTAADRMGKPIIPIFFDSDHIPPILKSRLGHKYDSFDFHKNIYDLHDIILKKFNSSLIQLSEKATHLKNMATMDYAQGNFPEALKRFEKVLQITEKLGDLRGKAVCLNYIGLIFRAQRNYPKALKRYEEVLEIFRRIGLDDSPNVSTFKNNIKDLKSDLSK